MYSYHIRASSRSHSQDVCILHKIFFGVPRKTVFLHQTKIPGLKKIVIVGFLRVFSLPRGTSTRGGFQPCLTKELSEGTHLICPWEPSITGVVLWGTGGHSPSYVVMIKHLFSCGHLPTAWLQQSRKVTETYVGDILGLLSRAPLTHPSFQMD